jgi:hypothetical protein
MLHFPLTWISSFYKFSEPDAVFFFSLKEGMKNYNNSNNSIQRRKHSLFLEDGSSETLSPVTLSKAKPLIYR